MNWCIKERVLHASYRIKSDVPTELLRLADAYEGVMPQRMGWNLPFSFIKTYLSSPSLPPLLLHSMKNDLADYLIVYPKNDLQTKKHELLHARYHMDSLYRKEVQALWSTFSFAEQEKVRRILLVLEYPNKEEILLDEFQAYYFTESPRFFGLPRSTLSRSFHKKKSPITKRK